MNLIATENSFCPVLNIIIHMLDTRFLGCLSDFKFLAYQYPVLAYMGSDEKI
jgi:hypothetical protein